MVSLPKEEASLSRRLTKAAEGGSVLSGNGFLALLFYCLPDDCLEAAVFVAERDERTGGCVEPELLGEADRFFRPDDPAGGTYI